MGIGSRIEPSIDSLVENKLRPAESATDIEFNLTLPKFTLANLVLPPQTEASIHDFLAYQKHEDLIFNQWGLASTHRYQRQTAVNFYGPPGTGKTMAAHAIANELKQPLVVVDYAEIESKYVGETSKNIAKLFELARSNNAIIFFDEADALLSRRVTNMSHATDVSVNQTRSVLLTLMNNHEGYILFATNFIENYDPAFMRRILAHIYFDLPNEMGREKLWEKYIPLTLPCDISKANLAIESDGLSGSDISSCVLKAAMSAARTGCEALSATHFQSAIKEIKLSKQANDKSVDTKETQQQNRIVTEQYVESQIGTNQMKELKQ